MAGIARKKSWAHPDGACTSCRMRKIKCGREKPECSTCCRDGHQCVYSSPPKRVNHIKVLCHNFDDIQERLTAMQSELSWLTARLRQPDAHGRVSGICEAHDQSPWLSPGSGVVMRDATSQIERYYGPWTLVAQCRRLETALMSYTKLGETEGASKLLGALVHESMSSHEIPSCSNILAAGESDIRIRLPPKQILFVMLEGFRENPDYATDIFNHQSIHAAMDRVYDDPSTPDAESWTLCFNLIILLGLGVENTLQSEDPFVRPIFQAVNAVVRSSRIFTEPRLVSVQALALFSLLVDRCYTGNGDIGDSILAQACSLAREIGLHQTHCHGDVHSGLALWEVEERHRVYQSLYIRDRYSTMASGSLLWLPNQITPPRNTSYYSAHWELSKIQDEAYRALSNAHDNTTERCGIAACVFRKLRIWQETYDMPCCTHQMGLCSTILHFEFLGTHMYLNMEFEDHTAEDILDCARLSCLLLIVCSAHSTNEHRQQAQALLTRLRLVRTRDSTWNQVSSISSSSASPLSFQPTKERTPSSLSGVPHSSNGHASFTTHSFHRLKKVFPVTAIFIIVRHILGIFPSSGASPGELISSDLGLLESLLLCFQTTASVFSNEEEHSNTRGYKLARVLKHLLNIIQTLQPKDNTKNPIADIFAPEQHFSGATLLSIPRDDNSHTEVEGADLWYSKDASSPTIDIPLPSLQSPWPTPQESVGASSTPLLATGAYMPPSMGPSTPVDLSQFFPPHVPIEFGVWDGASTVADMWQEGQSRKRRRIDYGPGG